MSKALKLEQFNRLLLFATPRTKRVVKNGVNGDKNFSKEFENYKWPGTRDFNLALIIIALYAYCLKQDGDLKTMAQRAIKKSKSANEKSESNAFNALKHGKGAKLVEYLKKDFTKDIQKLIFGVSNKDKFDDETIQVNGKDLTQEEFENMLNKTFEDGLFKQAAKIKPWKHNARDVADCVELLKGKITKENNADLEKELDKAYLGSIDDFFEKEELKEQLKSSKDIASSYYNQMDQHFTQSNKLSQQLEELKKERDNLQQELNKSNLTIEEQKKKIQEYETRKAKSKLLFTNSLKQMNEIIQKNTNLNKEEVKEVKEKTKKLQKTIDNFALKDAKPFILSNGESFAPNINKTRHKSMGDIPTITIDEIKKARKNLKPVDDDLLEKIQRQRKKMIKNTEEWLKEADAQKSSIDPAEYKKTTEEIASKRKEILKEAKSDKSPK